MTIAGRFKVDTEPTNKLNRQERGMQHSNRSIQEQLQWIQDHGGTRAAYVARYGSGSDASHYGDGGEAIFDADMAYLRSLQSRRLEARRDERWFKFRMQER